MPESEFRFSAFSQAAAGNQDGVQVDKHEVWDLATLVMPPANQRGCEVVVTAPAVVRAPQKVRLLLQEISMANGLGTPTPGGFLLSINPERTMLLLMPVARVDSPSVLPVSFDRNRFVLNLYTPFRYLNRLVPNGSRQVYPIEVTENPVRVGEAVGRAFMIRLDRFRDEQIRRPSGERKARQSRSGSTE